VVDANVERVVSRLFAVREPLPASRERLYALTDGITPAARNGDFAQAMMDLGATVCTPRAPVCPLCPLFDGCEARKEGQPDRYPFKISKAERPVRMGNAFWLEQDGHVLLVRRPSRGLLGGMLAFPTGEWAEKVSGDEGAPIPAAWQAAGGIEHVFTHFALTLRLHCAFIDRRPVEGIWWPVDSLEAAGLPTVFAKLIPRGRAWRDSTLPAAIEKRS